MSMLNPTISQPHRQPPLEMIYPEAPLLARTLTPSPTLLARSLNIPTTPKLGHVLIVDDGAMQRHYLCHVLKTHAKTIVQAEDGFDGLKKIIEATKFDHFDLVITDIDMPRLSGLNMVNALHDIMRSRIPIIAVSGTENLGDLAPYFDAILAKPVTKQRIFETIDVALAKRPPKLKQPANQLTISPIPRSRPREFAASAPTPPLMQRRLRHTCIVSPDPPPILLPPLSTRARSKPTAPTTSSIHVPGTAPPRKKKISIFDIASYRSPTSIR